MPGARQSRGVTEPQLRKGYTEKEKKGEPDMGDRYREITNPALCFLAAVLCMIAAVSQLRGRSFVAGLVFLVLGAGLVWLGVALVKKYRARRRSDKQERNGD